jgi:hypothetical protein
MTSTATTSRRALCCAVKSEGRPRALRFGSRAAEQQGHACDWRPEHEPSARPSARPTAGVKSVAKLTLAQAAGVLEQNRVAESQRRSRRRGRLLACDPPQAWSVSWFRQTATGEQKRRISRGGGRVLVGRVRLGDAVKDSILADRVHLPDADAIETKRRLRRILRNQVADLEHSLVHVTHSDYASGRTLVQEQNVLRHNADRNGSGGRRSMSSTRPSG